MNGSRGLEVRLYSKRVGTLRRSPTARLSFEYDAAYCALPEAAPLSVSMPVSAGAYGPERSEPWFNGLLAEGVRREHLARIVGCASLDTWALLRAAGGECAGAVQITAPEYVDEPGLTPIDEDRVAELLKERPAEPIGTVSRAARISLAGAQDKIALHRNADRSWSVPVAGHPSTHILKPETDEFPGLVENEHWCMEMARQCGIETATTSVETIGDVRVLVVERYDRARGADGTLKRLHQEDFAQALARKQKYQADGGPSAYDYFTVKGPERTELFERMMFHWLIGNCDAHAKNHSVIEPGTPRARLSPVYDVVCTECYPGLDHILATSIGRARDLSEVDHAAAEAMGRRIGFASGEAIERVHALAERLHRAVEVAERIGPPRGPIGKEAIIGRCDRACDWAAGGG